MISKGLIFFFCFIFGVTLFVPPVALSQKGDPTILDFKIQAMYRAAKLTWKAKGDLKNEMAVQVLRADTFEDAAYNEVGVVKIIPGKSLYEYIDKSMGSESKYYYKLIIKETNESFGPLSTRPYFSPPAT
jgi:hypothetical protein